MTKLKGEFNGHFSGTQVIKASALVPLNGWGETIFLSWHKCSSMTLTAYSFPQMKNMLLTDNAVQFAQVLEF